MSSLFAAYSYMLRLYFFRRKLQQWNSGQNPIFGKVHYLNNHEVIVVILGQDIRSQSDGGNFFAVSCCFDFLQVPASYSSSLCIRHARPCRLHVIVPVIIPDQHMLQYIERDLSCFHCHVQVSTPRLCEKNSLLHFFFQ